MRGRHRDEGGSSFPGTAEVPGGGQGSPPKALLHLPRHTKAVFLKQFCTDPVASQELKVLPPSPKKTPPPHPKLLEQGREQLGAALHPPQCPRAGGHQAPAASVSPPRVPHPRGWSGCSYLIQPCPTSTPIATKNQQEMCPRPDTLPGEAPATPWAARGAFIPQNLGSRVPPAMVGQHLRQTRKEKKVEQLQLPQTWNPVPGGQGQPALSSRVRKGRD